MSNIPAAAQPTEQREAVTTLLTIPVAGGVHRRCSATLRLRLPEKWRGIDPADAAAFGAAVGEAIAAALRAYAAGDGLPRTGTDG